MKKLIFILAVTLVSCAKQNVTPYDGIYRIEQADVLYSKLGYVKFEEGKEYQGNGADSWYKVGTYSFNDSIFSHTSNTGYTYKALYFVSGNKLIFRDVNYKFNYPTGGEPKDVLTKN